MGPEAPEREHPAVAAGPPPVTVNPHALLRDTVGAKLHGVLAVDKTQRAMTLHETRGAADVVLAGWQNPAEEPAQDHHQQKDG